MTESEYYNRVLKKQFALWGVFFKRIENPSVPDIYLSRSNNAVWIEMKCINRLCKIIRPEWRHGQLSWIREHQLKGGDNIFLALYYCEKSYFLKPKEAYAEEELVCQKNSIWNLLIRK